MEVGDQATFMGPVASRFEYTRETTRHMGLIAVGTGITPMWQVIQEALADPSDTTRLSLVYASRAADNILLKAEIDEAVAANPGRLSVSYLVSPPDAKRRRAAAPLPPGVRYGRIDESVLLAELPPPPDGSTIVTAERHGVGNDIDRPACQLLVSGPETMLRELCGPRARDGGVSAGPAAAQAKHPALGGTLRKLGYRSNQVSWL